MRRVGVGGFWESVESLAAAGCEDEMKTHTGDEAELRRYGPLPGSVVSVAVVSGALVSAAVGGRSQ